MTTINNIFNNTANNTETSLIDLDELNNQLLQAIKKQDIDQFHLLISQGAVFDENCSYALIEYADLQFLSNPSLYAYLLQLNDYFVFDNIITTAIKLSHSEKSEKFLHYIVEHWKQPFDMYSFSDFLRLSIYYNKYPLAKLFISLGGDINLQNPKISKKIQHSGSENIAINFYKYNQHKSSSSILFKTSFEHNNIQLLELLVTQINDYKDYGYLYNSSHLIGIYEKIEQLFSSHNKLPLDKDYECEALIYVFSKSIDDFYDYFKPAVFYSLFPKYTNFNAFNTFLHQKGYFINKDSIEYLNYKQSVDSKNTIPHEHYLQYVDEKQINFIINPTISTIFIKYLIPYYDYLRTSKIFEHLNVSLDNELTTSNTLNKNTVNKL